MTAPVAQNESRRIQRIALPLPARIEVKVDNAVAWNEVTRLTDVSAFGAGFALKRPIKRGRLVLLTIPMPKQLRCFGHSEEQYRIWGVVRRCITAPQASSGEAVYMLGVAFVGKTAPASYYENPATLYDISHREEEGLWHIEKASLTESSDETVETRRQTRFSIPETVLIEALDVDGNVENSETTVTENLSVGGAALFTSLAAEAGSFIRVTCLRNNITIISIVRGRRMGADGMVRLHVEFVDRFFPLEGIE
jgi:hypothetical protein